jgi:hypothetical protein
VEGEWLKGFAILSLRKLHVCQMSGIQQPMAIDVEQFEKRRKKQKEHDVVWFGQKFVQMGSAKIE